VVVLKATGSKAGAVVALVLLFIEVSFACYDDPTMRAGRTRR
jgi:hypothetical protein